jgi:hypothetical protein
MRTLRIIRTLLASQLAGARPVRSGFLARKKFEPAAVAPHQMTMKQAKRRKSAGIRLFSAKIAVPFTLSSSQQTGILWLADVPVSAGTGGPFLFFDSAETT